MSNRTGTYWISIASAPAARCEDLGIAPATLARSSLQPDVLLLHQYRRRGEWAVEMAHDAPVRFYRELPGGTLEQLFMGRVVSPANEHDNNARRRAVRVMNVMQFAAECIFHRGDWLPTFPATQSPDFDNADNGDFCSLFWGHNYKQSGGSLYKANGRQTVRLAVDEALYSLGRMAVRAGVGDEWRPVVDSVFFGTAPLEPLWSAEQPSTYLDWLVKCTQPLPDGFVAVSYAGARPAIRAGRYRDQAATDLQSTGFPTTAFAFARERHQEVAGVVFARLTTDMGEGGFSPDFGPYRWRAVLGTYPNAAVRSLDRRVRTVSVEDILSVSNDVLVNFLGPGMVQPQIQASLSAAGAWSWLHPGAVLAFDGLRLNVQTTTLDLATEIVSATMGLPRQLGLDDLERLIHWLTRWARRGASA